MNKTKSAKNLFRESAIIVALSIFFGLVYNFFSGTGIPLIRVEPKKIAVSDSVLFTVSAFVDTTKHTRHPTDSIPKDVKVIAPLHERALSNPDSMEKLFATKRSEIINVISLQQLKRLLDEKRGILLDARGKDEFKKGHIKGSRNIPALEAVQHFEELAVMPRDTLILIYCNNVECHLGRMLADFMKVMEFKNIYLYDEGWDGWVQAKMPVDTTEEQR